MFCIGNIKINNNIVLAPMAGISNPSYIKLCEEMGLGYAITELISAESIVRGNKKTFEMLEGIDSLKIPVAVQIFGSNPESMGLAAKILVESYKVKMIDINMGCPVPKVCIKSQAGSALLKDVSLVYEIVKNVVNSVSVPVTVKIRSGWDFSSINAVEVSKAIESAGASCIAVHARTRSQGYSGKADWSIIKQVKENVKIPVIGNGDINSYYDAEKMISETGCDAVMIGRACIGNPWLIKECINYIEYKEEPVLISLEERINMIKKHISYLLLYKPEKVVVLEMRMHIAKYLKGINGCSELKVQINKVKSILEINNLLDEFLKEKNNEQ